MGTSLKFGKGAESGIRMRLAGTMAYERIDLPFFGVVTVAKRDKVPVTPAVLPLKHHKNQWFNSALAVATLQPGASRSLTESAL
jgi:hypothetical protein